jgi:murein DD-endopeptidase MepM/ murein hydrolase activator NlpD
MPRRPAVPARPLAAASAALVLLAACAGRRPAPAPPAASRPAPAPANVLSDADLQYLGNRALAVPVAGARASRVWPSFHAPRSGGRVHQAVDIMAPRGTPVVAADEGRVWKLRSNALGGITVYATDPLERFVYYYAHLSRYHAGLFEGQPLFRGDTLGYVGTTGNAPPNAPHLHFQISRVARDGQWWGGTPVDPLPFLRAAELAREAGDGGGTVAAGGRAGDRLVRPAALVRPTVPADTADPEVAPR